MMSYIYGINFESNFERPHFLKQKRKDKQKTKILEASRLTKIDNRNCSYETR